MSIRIVSDGTPSGTSVYAGDVDITNDVGEITWTLNASKGVAEVRVQLAGLAQVEATGLDVTAGDWMFRCKEVYTGEHGVQRCGFPALDSTAWYLHGEEHETPAYGWGGSEVLAAKRARWGEASA